jgi:hypothetical protein
LTRSPSPILKETSDVVSLEKAQTAGEKVTCRLLTKTNKALFIMADPKLPQKLIRENPFKRLVTRLVLLAFLNQNLAFATQSIIELDFKNSQTPQRLHVIPRLSNVGDVSHLEIDTEQKQAVVYLKEKQEETLDDLQQDLSQSHEVSVTTKPVILQKHNIINLPWELEPEKLTLFILNHTAWLSPLSEDGYKLEFKGGLLGGMKQSGGNQKNIYQCSKAPKTDNSCWVKGGNFYAPDSSWIGKNPGNISIISNPNYSQTGGSSGSKGTSSGGSGWQSVLGKGWDKIKENGDKARDRMQKQQENLKKLSTVGQPVEIYKRQDIIIPHNPLSRIQPPQPSLPFPKDWDSKVDRIDRGMTRLSWCEMYYLARKIGVPDEVIEDWKNNRASNKVKLSDYLATKKKIELEKAKKEEEATKKKLQAIKEEQMRVEQERAKIQKMSSPDEYDRYYIETTLLPHIRKMVGPSYTAYNDYKVFITHPGTGYTPGRDINEYWQSWLNSKTWGEVAKKNPLPTYKLPMHLVRDQETFDRNFIETTLLPHIQKYTSHSGYKDYKSFISTTGTGYKLGMDMNAYMDSWKNWKGGVIKDFPKYGVPDTCNPFYGDYEKLKRVQTLINTVSWEAVYDYANKQGFSKEDVQYVSSRRTENISFDNYMKEVFDDQVLEGWGVQDRKEAVDLATEFIQVGGIKDYEPKRFLLKKLLENNMVKNGLGKAKDVVQQGWQKAVQAYKIRKIEKLFNNKNFKQDHNIPENWQQLLADKQNGIKYQAPKNPRFNEVRFMKGNPKSDFPAQRVDYVKIKKDGHYRDKLGSVVREQDEAAHIPLPEFNFNIGEFFK